MLKLEIITNPDQRNQTFIQYMDNSALWIVSDLQAKFNLQNQLLAHRNKTISGDEILRASELWRKMLHRLDPSWNIISPSLAQLLMEKWIDENKSTPITGKDSRKAFITMEQILPLLTHAQGNEVIEEWFQLNGEAKARWHHWFQLCESLWQDFYRRKIIPENWIKALLTHLELPQPSSDIIVFDLGFMMEDIEAELILNLSRQHEVVVVVPGQQGAPDSYQNLFGKGEERIFPSQDFSNQRVFKKLPSMLSEVKEATALVRKWADQGIDLSSMGIVSPAIENYWPTLSEYLLVEGIPVNKPVVATFSQVQVYQKWLASMRLSLSQARQVDGQQYFFDEYEDPGVDFRSFQRLFANINSSEDFYQDSVWANRLPKIKERSEHVSFPQFLEWALSFFPKTNLHLFDQLIQQFDEAYAIQETLPLDRWVSFFETFFARKEKRIEEGEPHGLQILTPGAAESIDLKKVIFLGLSEQNLKDSIDSALGWGDIESLKIQFGFSLPHGDRHLSYQQMKWIDKKSFDEAYYLHSETDFSGRFQAPSLYWLKGAMAQSSQSLSLQAPSSSRWDQLMQGQNPSEDLAMSMTSQALARQGVFIQRDFGDIEPEPTQIAEVSFSASTLEEYFACPFRFLAIKGFRLSNLPSLDLDVDYLTRGRLIHKICEEIVRGNNFCLSQEKMTELVEKSRESIAMDVFDDALWDIAKPFYIKLAMKFMENERVWREQYPETKSIYFEKFLETQINLLEDTPLFTKESNLLFRGAIDRMDKSSNGEWAIIDYKSSDAGLTQYGSWIKNGKIQLALYSLALSEGVITGQEENVVGAFYYTMNSMDRSKGFAIAESDSSFIPSKKMTIENREQLFMETKTLTRKIIKQILEGELGPHPQDLKLCTTCHWKPICRHPQHNH